MRSREWVRDASGKCIPLNGMSAARARTEPNQVTLVYGPTGSYPRTGLWELARHFKRNPCAPNKPCHKRGPTFVVTCVTTAILAISQSASVKNGPRYTLLGRTYAFCRITG